LAATGGAGGAKRIVEKETRQAGIELMENDLEFSYRSTEDVRRRYYEFGASIDERVRT